MKVLFCCGSPLPTSSNRRVLTGLLTHLDPIEVEWTSSIDTLPILRGDRLADLPGEVIALRKAVAAAEAVVVAGPEYGGGLAGGLKNALDWCVGAEQGFYGKPVVAMAVSASGGEHARRQLAQTLLWQGAHLVSTAAFATAQVSPEDIQSAGVERTLSDVAGALRHWSQRSFEERQLHTQTVADSIGIDAYPHRIS